MASEHSPYQSPENAHGNTSNPLNYEPARRGRRFLAFVLDGLVFIFAIAVSAILAILLRESRLIDPGGQLYKFIMAPLMLIIAGSVYGVGIARARSPGMLVLNLHFRAEDGGKKIPAAYLRSVLRVFMYLWILFALAMYAGYESQGAKMTDPLEGIVYLTALFSPAMHLLSALFLLSPAARSLTDRLTGTRIMRQA